MPSDENTPNRALRITVQLSGFVVGVGLLAYCVRLAFNDRNREGIRRLGEADAGTIAALLGVTAAGFIISGVQFWLTLRPVRRLRPADVLATHFTAILLSYLPFKLSFLFRVAVHRQRDGVPLVMIGPWFGAVGLALLIPTLPIVALARWRPQLDWIGLGVILITTLAMAWLTSAAARAFGGERGIRLAHRAADAQPLGVVRRAVRSDSFRTFDEALGMLRGTGRVAGLMALRLADIAAYAMRFVIVSRMLGTPLSLGDAVLASVVHFFIGVFSPIGSLGAREAGTAGLFDLFGSIDFDRIAVIAVVVTGAELMVAVVLAACGIAWLRPDRLIRRAQNGPPAP